MRRFGDGTAVLSFKGDTWAIRHNYDITTETKAKRPWQLSVFGTTITRDIFFGSSRCNFGTFAIHRKHALHRPVPPLVHHLAEPPWLHTASPVFQLPAFRTRGCPKSAKQKIMKVMTCHFGHFMSFPQEVDECTT